MDGMTNIAKQQQTQVSTPDVQSGTSTKVQQEAQQQVKGQSNALDASQNTNDSEVNQAKPIKTKEDVQNLVQDLNTALEPMKTNLQFGVDSENVFYVSVTEANTGRMLRRFPAEKAQEFLPKMQEVSGIFLDTKG
jgi:flagellar protein FlaG